MICFSLGIQFSEAFYEIKKYAFFAKLRRFSYIGGFPIYRDFPIYLKSRYFLTSNLGKMILLPELLLKMSETLHNLSMVGVLQTLCGNFDNFDNLRYHGNGKLPIGPILTDFGLKSPKSREKNY